MSILSTQSFVFSRDRDNATRESACKLLLAAISPQKNNITGSIWPKKFIMKSLFQNKLEAMKAVTRALGGFVKE